jgi:DNA-binding HxlR family transcriptional regulator
MACSLSRTWSVIGEPWTPLIIRDLAIGLTRFEQFQTDLGIARNVLTERLHTLLQAGVIERREYQSENRRREEYVLTPMGKDLVPIVMAITQWGDRWLDDGAGPPVVFHHDRCEHASVARLVCDHCNDPLEADELTLVAGPGSRAGPGTYAAQQLPRSAG